MDICDMHGTEMRTERLTRLDGTPVGSLTYDVCDECEAEAEGNLSEFLNRVRVGDFSE